MAQEKSKMEKFQEMEGIMRQVAQEEALKVYNKQATQYAVPKVPYHVHNGIDSPQLTPLAMNFLGYLPANSGGVIDPAVLDTQTATWKQFTLDDGGVIGVSSNQPQIPVFQLPVIYGYGVGGHSAFNGGTAPEGTMVVFSNAGTTGQIFVMIQGTWRGITLDLTA